MNNGEHPIKTLQAALAYRRGGLSVIPVRGDGSKAPAVAWIEYQQRLPTEQEIQAWFRNAKLGVGVVAGEVSGHLEIIDFDAQAETTFAEWCQLVDAELPELVARLSIRQTPKPGYHVAYRCSEVKIPGNTKLACSPAGVLIETRGEGGQVLVPGCPPNCHPSGRLYVHHSGPLLSNVPTITAAEREALLRCARSFDQAVVEQPHTRGASDGTRPGDEFNRRGPDWADLLEPAGWATVHRRGSIRYWRRPGKDGSGWSATTGACTSKDGNELLAVFSSNASPFEGATTGRACSCYSKFSTFAMLNHRGDYGAAAKALAAQGYGAQRNGKAPPRTEHEEHGDSWEGPDASTGASNEALQRRAEAAYQYRFEVIDAADLEAKDCLPEWGIKRVLVMKQPGVWGGPLKCMKTSTVFDGAVSLATATKFLGEFSVYQRRRVVVLSGESGEFAIKNLCQRICLARGLKLSDCAGYLKIGFKLPKFGNAIEMLAMRDGLKGCGAEVAILDPLYLSLFGGGDQDASSASNLYATGPLLLTVAQTCLEIGVTPIICHHFRRSVPPPPAVPELSWLSHSGVAEFARQWILLSRREEYDPDSGAHRLWLATGGSVGHSNLSSLDIDEGRLSDDFSGRVWQATVQTAQQERATFEARRQDEKDSKLAARFLAALDELDPNRTGISIRKVRAAAGMSGDTVERALLLAAHCVEEIKVKTTRGLADGVRRRGTSGTDVGQVG